MVVRNGTFDKDTLYGSGAADTLVGNAGEDLLYGYAGLDLLKGGLDKDTLHGGDGADRLYGDASEDSLYGENGNDTLYGGSSATDVYDGKDFLDGGTGADWLFGGFEDTLFGGGGTDTLVGTAGNDALYGDDEKGETIVGAADSLFGGNGDDILYGGGGNDTLNAGASFETNEGFGGLGVDSLWGGANSDYFDGSEGNDTLNGNAGNDILYGDESVEETLAGDDQVNGGAGDDFLDGGAGVDRVNGGEGSDVVFGGEDSEFQTTRDRLTGGGGNDYFQLLWMEYEPEPPEPIEPGEIPEPTEPAPVGDYIVDFVKGDDFFAIEGLSFSQLGFQDISLMVNGVATPSTRIYVNSGTGVSPAAEETLAAVAGVRGLNNAAYFTDAAFEPIEPPEPGDTLIGANGVQDIFELEREGWVNDPADPEPAPVGVTVLNFEDNRDKLSLEFVNFSSEVRITGNGTSTVKIGYINDPAFPTPETVATLYSANGSAMTINQSDFIQIV